MRDEDEVIISSDREVEVYKGRDGKYRWRVVARRGNLPDEIIGDSGQGYALSRSAKKMAESLFPDYPIKVVKGDSK